VTHCGFHRQRRRSDLLFPGIPGRGQTQVLTQVLAVIEEKARRNTKLVLEESAAQKILPREAAMRLALKRLEQAMTFKRWSIY
jgi:hypothetical protein